MGGFGVVPGSPLVQLIDRTLVTVASSAFAPPAGFASYLVQLLGITLDTATNGLGLQLSTDGGTTPLATSYLDAFTGIDTAGAAQIGSGTTTYIPIGGVTGAANTLDLDGWFLLTRFNAGAQKSRIHGLANYYKGGAAVVHSAEFFGVRDVAAAYNAFVLIGSAGANISGRVKVYGYK